MAKDIRAKLILDTKDAQKSVDRVGGALKALVSAAALQQFVSLGDQFTQITNRLKSVSDSTQQASAAFNLVQQVAADTRSDLGSVADLFTDLTIATDEMGLSQQQVAGVASTFSKALKISGADANAASGAIRQFGQALASGVLRGDEFNSIMEANPAFMRAVAEQLGVNVGKLREMAAEGKLTSDVLVRATQEIGASIDEDFGKTVATVGESFTMLKNEFIALIGNIQEQTGIFTIMANAVKLVADNLDIVASIMAGVFAAAVIGRIASTVAVIIQFSKALRAAAVSGAVLQAIVAGPAGIVKVLGGLVVGGGALVVMNELFEKADESAGDVAAEAKKIADNAAEAEKSSKELLDNSEQQTEEEKAKKKEQDEQLRILTRQKEELASISGELAIGRDELTRSLDLEQQLASASAIQRDNISDIADLENQRATALRDLNDLTLLTADQRLVKEQEINDEYDERIRLTQEANEELLKIGTFRQVEQNIVAVNKALIDYNQQLSILKTIQEGATNQEVRDLQELASLYQSTNAQLQEINKEFFGVPLLGGQEAKAQKELTAAEAEEYEKRYLNFIQYQSDLVAALQMFQEARAKIEEKGTTFLSGYQKAAKEFGMVLKDQAQFGEKIFNDMAQSFEDAIVNFVETGKLSFKDLFRTLLMEIIKMQANKIFFALFSPGGIFGDLFAGFFNMGGNIPAGKIGIAGENGPEIISGPASVMSTANSAGILGGSTQVVYNIQAVDAPSFQALVASDPQFIYAVTQAGRRTIPGSR